MDADVAKKLRMILAGTLGTTGYCFLASRVTNEPNFGAVMMEAVFLAYELGRDDERVDLSLQPST